MNSPSVEVATGTLSVSTLQTVARPEAARIVWLEKALEAALAEFKNCDLCPFSSKKAIIIGKAKIKIYEQGGKQK
jgi:hypothetical protein